VNFARIWLIQQTASHTMYYATGNGIPNMINRHHNMIWSTLANDALTASIITDSFHLPPAVIKSFLRAKTTDRTVVVSDILCLGGQPPGDYILAITGDEVVRLEENGFLHMPSRSCMAGSSRNMIQCMNHLHGLGLLSLEEMAKVSFHNPLRLLGLTADDIASKQAVRKTDEQAKIQKLLIKPTVRFDQKDGFSLCSSEITIDK
jgi:N-acetylglucosamine-6-phosphate deacetylase